MRGQLLDALSILLLLFATLFFTTYLTKMQEQRTSAAAPAATVAPLKDLAITAAERGQFQKLLDSGMTDLASVNMAVQNNHPDPDKYKFSVSSLLITLAVIATYLIFVYGMSFKEYKEVVEEKFAAQEGMR